MSLPEIALFIQLSLALTFSINNTYEIVWEELDKGLYFTQIGAPIQSDIGDSQITLLRIDPAYYHFNLISSKELQIKQALLPLSMLECITWISKPV